jgi:polyisoprenoid-binding protein YceI
LYCGIPALATVPIRLFFVSGTTLALVKVNAKFKHLKNLTIMKRISLFSFLSLLLLATSSVFAQDTQQVRIDRNAVFFVDGTSTLHDWTVESADATGTITMSETGIASVSVRVPVESLKSGKSGMDRRMYDALESRRHDTITFTSSSVTLSEDGRSGVAKGELTIIGQKRNHEVAFTLTGTGNEWTFAGASTFTMTSFSMEPPTAVMGTIRTGDEITVRFEINSRRPSFVAAQ